MPGGDGTGPMGMGPMTGWGRGWCAGYVGTDFSGADFGRGFGRGRGLGRRRRFGPGGWGSWDAPPPAAERAALERQVQLLGRMLAELQERLDRLDRAGNPRAAGEQP